MRLAALILAVLSGCTTSLCHPQDGYCISNPRSMASMSAEQLEMELSK